MDTRGGLVPDSRLVTDSSLVPDSRFLSMQGTAMIDAGTSCFFGKHLLEII